MMNKDTLVVLQGAHILNKSLRQARAPSPIPYRAEHHHHKDGVQGVKAGPDPLTQKLPVRNRRSRRAGLDGSLTILHQISIMDL